jgi:hypothetical protein
MYRYVLKERDRKTGEVWTSPEAYETEDFRRVVQAVIGGFTSSPRWAETSPGSENPGFFLYGLDRRGKEHKTGTACEDFSE